MPTVYINADEDEYPFLMLCNYTMEMFGQETYANVGAYKRDFS